MKTLDLRTLGVASRPIKPDMQTVVLRRRYDSHMTDWVFELMTPERPTFHKLTPDKGLKYATHSLELSMQGKGRLQLALAISLHVYSVSQAIAMHKRIAEQYLPISQHVSEFTITFNIPV